MKSFACKGCGIVYDRDFVSSNNIYQVGPDTMFHCHVCNVKQLFERKKIEQPLINLHQGGTCAICDKHRDAYYEGSINAEELKSLTEKHMEAKGVIPLDDPNRDRSGFTPEEIKSLSGSHMPVSKISCKNGGDCS